MAYSGPLTIIDNYKQISSPEICAKILKSRFLEERESDDSLLVEAAKRYFNQYFQNPRKQVRTPILWIVKMELEYKLKVQFQALFPNLSHVKMPEEVGSYILYTPRLIRIPLQPMTKKVKTSLRKRIKRTLTKDSNENRYALVPRPSLSDSIIQNTIEFNQKQKELFMRDVIGRFTQDYVLRLMPISPEFLLIGHINLSSSLQEGLAYLTQKLGYEEVNPDHPGPRTMSEREKKVLLSIFKGLDRFFCHFSKAIEKISEQPLLRTLEQERSQDGLPNLFSVDMTPFQAKAFFVNELTETVLKIKPALQEKPEMKLIASLLSTFIASGVDQFLEQGGLYLLIDHLITNPFDAALLDPSPDLSCFPCDDKAFNVQAGALIASIAQSLSQTAPASGMLGFALNKGLKWAQGHQEEMGKKVQQFIHMVLATPDRAGIFFMITHLLWHKTESGLHPVFPNAKDGKRLKQSPELLQKRVVEYLIEKIGSTLNVEAPIVFNALRIIKKAGYDYSANQSSLRKFLEESVSVFFKLLDDKLLPLMLLGYLSDDLRCKKSV